MFKFVINLYKNQSIVPYTLMEIKFMVLISDQSSLNKKKSENLVLTT